MRSGGQVRITAELIDARVDKHMWSETYQGDLRDALTLQNDVARAIASQIQVNVNPREQATLRSAKTVVPEAYEAYLKGRFFWNKRTADSLKRAKEYFDQASAKDPGYAQAYSGLADTYALMGDWQYAVMAPTDALPRAKAAAIVEANPKISKNELAKQIGVSRNSVEVILDGWWTYKPTSRTSGSWERVKNAGSENEMALLDPGASELAPA